MTTNLSGFDLEDPTRPTDARLFPVRKSFHTSVQQQFIRAAFVYNPLSFEGCHCGDTLWNTCQLFILRWEISITNFFRMSYEFHNLWISLVICYYRGFSGVQLISELTGSCCCNYTHQPAGVPVCDWLLLPDEVWLTILSLLSASDLCKVAPVCSRLRTLAADHTLCKPTTAWSLPTGCSQCLGAVLFGLMYQWDAV